ncbi:MAG: hypothetical protein SFT94_09850 [Pseudanabaenaceae cyanobacterium bins.68]|nr:hypothetical protein [Pseudanabaenaceae cyanobacterium bins.68]
MASGNPRANPWLTFFQEFSQWFCGTPDRAIAAAYQSAKSIQELEQNFFNGNPIARECGYTNSNDLYFGDQLQKHLQEIKIRLAEYRIAAKFPLGRNRQAADQQSDLVQKLTFIDFILARYEDGNVPQPSIPVQIPPSVLNLADYSYFAKEPSTPPPEPLTPIEKSILPGPLIRTVKRIWSNARTSSYQEYENDVIQELQVSRQRIRATVSFFGSLALAFLIVQNSSYHFMFSPLVDYWNRDRQLEVDLSPRMQDLEIEIIEKYRNLKVKLELERLVQQVKEQRQVAQSSNFRVEAASLNPLDSPELAEEFSQEAVRLVEELNSKSLLGIKHGLADALAAIAVYITIYFKRRQLKVIKASIDETLYSLNDTGKALLLIISTDIVVGFHSSDGWEALIGSVSGRYGLPDDPFFTRVFVSIFPVVLDGLFKFWIFQYLRKNSPSTATIYEQMNR